MDGSERLAAEMAASGQRAAGVLVFDMIGYTCMTPGCAPGNPDPDARGDFILALGNTASAPLLSRFTSSSAASVPGLPVFAWTVEGNGETAAMASADEDGDGRPDVYDGEPEPTPAVGGVADFGE